MFGLKSKNVPSDQTGSVQAGFFKRLRMKLNRGNSWLTYDLANLLPGGKIDAAVLDELETRLITADVGVETTEKILAGLRKQGLTLFSRPSEGFRPLRRALSHRESRQPRRGQ